MNKDFSGEKSGVHDEADYSMDGSGEPNIFWEAKTDVVSLSVCVSIDSKMHCISNSGSGYILMMLLNKN